MKSISAGLSTHLDGEVTTLASCWKVVRKDGVAFYFTDHDQDITFEGNVYEAESSYDRTAIANGSDMGVDNLDVSGILDSDKLSEQDMRNGLFNRADVYIFIVNWANPAQGALKVRRGWFGEVTITDTGMFTTEIRGLAQALSHNFIEVYSAECRADFCDTRCKLNITDFEQRGTVSNRGDGKTYFSASDIADAPTVNTSAGAHKYWSIKPTNYPAGKFEIGEIRFYDQAGNVITGGTAKDNVDGGDKPTKLRDGSYSTKWGFDPAWNDEDDNDADIAIEDVRWWVEFGSNVEVARVEMICTDNPTLAPTAFSLQYMDTVPNENAIDQVWTTAKTCGHIFTVAGQSALFALGSDTASPINFVLGDGTDLPGPTNGVSSFVGGTVRWLTGKNAGRTVEILGYVDATNTVTMFEGMSYAIEVGDTFVIAQGCDGSLARCKLYDNVVNRRAEDYVPGNDELMKYPDAPQQ